MNNDVNNDNNLSEQLQPTPQVNEQPVEQPIEQPAPQVNEQPIEQPENNNVSVSETIENASQPVNQVPTEVNQPSLQNNVPNTNNKNNNLIKIIIIIAVLAVAGVLVFFLLNSGKGDGDKGNDKGKDSDSSKLLKDANISGYACLDSVCTLSVGDEEKEEEFSFDGSKFSLLKELNDYDSYIKVNIYYEEEASKKTINNYELFLKSDGSKLENVKTEEELREKIGLFGEGEHTEELTLTDADEYPSSFYDENDQSYIFYNYTFNDNNIEYIMKYKTEGDGLNLTVGNKYSVKFKVEKGSFDYEYTIIEVK